MKVVSPDEMRQLDKITIEEYGLPSIVLMENAALATLEAIVENCPPEMLMRGVLVLCGSGNNAGDGLAVARHLILRGYPVSIFLLKKPRKNDPLINFRFLQKLKAPMYVLEENEENFWGLLLKALLRAGCVIDALLGTGVKGELSEEYVKAIRLINSSWSYKVSIDIPSGINPETGELLAPEAVKANLTVTMGFIKRGLILYPGAEYVGKLVVANISIPAHLSAKVKEELLLPSEAALMIPERSPLGHKYKFGVVVVIGGPKPYTGASHLAALGALRGGAGMTYLLVPEETYTIADVKLTEVIVDTYNLSEGDFKEIDPYLERADTVVIGMGWGLNPLMKELLKKVIKGYKGRIVIDGDGLKLLAELISEKEISLEDLKGRSVLTPHSGELSKFFQIALGRSEDITFKLRTEHQRYKYAKRLSLLTGSVVLAKGNPTIVVNDEKVYYVGSTSVAMAKGGSGDVLSGITGALISQVRELDKGVALASLIHGMAAQLARKKLSHYSVAPSDIVKYIPLAFNVLMNLRPGHLKNSHRSLLERMGFWKV